MAAEDGKRIGWLVRIKWPLLSLHVLAWTALAAVAYANAGPYSKANCWHLLLIYLPPLQFLVIAIAVVSSIALLMSLFDAKARAHPALLLAWHGAILILGLLACAYAAYTAAGPVSCL